MKRKNETMIIKQRKKPVVLFYHGLPNHGKTTVLKGLMNLLAAEGVWCYVWRKKPHSPDCRAVVLFENELVGIATGGDSPSTVEKNCEFFKQFGCSVAVTACREPFIVLSAKRTKLALVAKWARCHDVVVSSNVSDASKVTQLVSLITRMITHGSTTSISYSQKNPYVIRVW